MYTDFTTDLSEKSGKVIVMEAMGHIFLKELHVVDHNYCQLPRAWLPIHENG